MTTFTTDLPCVPLRQGAEVDGRYIESAKDAAKVFAGRYARRQYGKRGICHHVRLDTYVENGRSANYEAFIGVPDRQGGGITGQNIWLTVTVE